MTTVQTSDKIASFEVRGLFGRFNHRVQFEDNERIAIITAPNGYGKTVLLKAINALFKEDFNSLLKIPFNSIRVILMSGREIYIHRDSPTLNPDENSLEGGGVGQIKTTGFGYDGKSHPLSPIFEMDNLRYFERYASVDRLSQDLWFDHRMGRSFSTAEIIERYADRLPKEFQQDFVAPEWVQQATSVLHTHLVETQRLLSIDEDEKIPPRFRRDTVRTTSVVEKDASDLSKTIGKVLQEYANNSQKLDESFPKRIIEFRDGSVKSDADIRCDLDQLRTKRDELVDVGMIGRFTSEPIAATDAFEDDSVRRILSIYAEDTRIKLSTFDELYKKISLFKQIIEEHFKFKKIQIDPNVGFVALDEDTGENIPLSELSSGEQHEIVLIYELLFNVKQESLILIDEPELSLHVAWQKRFIEDLQKIQKIKGATILIATHSPQVINDRWDLVQELGYGDA